MLKRFTIVITILLLLTTLISCDGDNPLKAPDKKERYDLPGNTIPDSLMEQVRFLSDQNVIYGYWLSSNGERPGITILFLGGNEDSMDDIWNKVVVLYDLGVNIFVFDYRGFGMSGGETTLQGIKNDGVTALNYVLSREEVNPDSLVYYSYSLGSIVSFYLATEQFSPFSIIAESALAKEKSTRYPYLVDGNYCYWLRDTDVDNIEVIKDIHAPIILYHGDNDRELDYNENSKFLYWFANEPKERILVEGAGHYNLIEVMNEVSFKNSIIKWFYYSTLI